jgi:hypothetical protein
MSRCFIVCDEQAAQFLLEWLSRIKHGLQSIRQLSLLNFCSEAHAKLLARCTNLSRLTLRTPRRSCYGQTMPGGFIEPCYHKETSWSNTDFQALRGLQKLQPLEWRLCHPECAHEMKAVARSKIGLKINIVCVPAVDKDGWRNITAEFASKWVLDVEEAEYSVSI